MQNAEEDGSVQEIGVCLSPEFVRKYFRFWLNGFSCWVVESDARVDLLRTLTLSKAAKLLVCYENVD